MIQLSVITTTIIILSNSFFIGAFIMSLSIGIAKGRNTIRTPHALPMTSNKYPSASSDRDSIGWKQLIRRILDS